MTDKSELWARKGETLSDSSAKKEYDLTEGEIMNAIRNGELQYREGNMHGNPWFRLLRCEVEELVTKLRGKDYFKNKKIQNELKQIDKMLKKMKKEIASLERRRTELLSNIG